MASLVCCLGFSFMILLVDGLLVWLLVWVGFFCSLLLGFLRFACLQCLRVVGFAVTTSLWYFVLVWFFVWVDCGLQVWV